MKEGGKSGPTAEWGAVPICPTAEREKLILAWSVERKERKGTTGSTPKKKATSWWVADKNKKRNAKLRKNKTQKKLILT